MIVHDTHKSTSTWTHYTPLIAALASAVLVIWKAIIWWQEYSLAVKASLVDSTLDMFTSAINFCAIRAALKPSDACHRFGHDKAEALASLGQAALMIALSIYVAYESALSLWLGNTTLVITDDTLIMIGASTVIALGLATMQTLAVRHSRSLALRADLLHYRLDFLTHLCVWCTLYLGYVWLDRVVAVILSAYLCYGAWHLLHEASHILMDRELEDAIRERIQLIVLAHPKVHSLNHLRTRFSGHQQFIQLNVVLSASLSLQEAHIIAHELEVHIQEDDPSVYRDITIHQEPELDAHPTRFAYPKAPISPLL